MWTIRALPWGVPDGTRPLWRAFGMLSVWWKTNASVSVLFWAVLPQFTHGKMAWASNMNPKELNFYIFVELSLITKKGRLKGPCLVLVIE